MDCGGKHECIGFGPNIGYIGEPDIPSGTGDINCDKYNNSGNPPQCSTLKCSVAQEKYLCDTAAASKAGWPMCGYDWVVKKKPKYFPVIHNCEDYLTCLLSKCHLSAPYPSYWCIPIMYGLP